MFVGQKVVTPYGEGLVLEIRHGDKIVVQPTTWNLANNQRPTFYMNPNDVKPYFAVGDKVLSAFGNGKVIECRDSDGIYVVTLDNWQLADGKSPTLYLNEQSFKRYSEPAKDKQQDSKNSFVNVYQRAMTEKDLAKDLYVAQKFMEAKWRYSRAVETLRDITEEMTNEEKGKYFEMSVTCNSNLALCSWGLSEWNDCIVFGKNSLTLIEALESKIGDSQIWNSMVEKGIMTAEKMKDLKGKAYRIIGKAELKKKNYLEAKNNLKSALNYTTNEKMQKELNELLADATKKNAQEEKKEKSTWQKAFKKGSKGEGDLYTSSQGEDDSAKQPKASPINKDAKKNNANSNSSKEKDSSKENNSQVWKADNFFSSSLFGTFLFMGTIGLLGTAAYWWSKRRR